MIKKYLNHMYAKEPHERRQHAMQLATGITGVALVVWVTTLGVRFAMSPQQLAAQNADSANQVASVVESQQGNATLIVATSTDSSYTDTSGNFKF
jgi:hypothetical protein